MYNQVYMEVNLCVCFNTSIYGTNRFVTSYKSFILHLTIFMFCNSLQRNGYISTEGTC